MSLREQCVGLSILTSLLEGLFAPSVAASQHIARVRVNISITVTCLYLMVFVSNHLSCVCALGV